MDTKVGIDTTEHRWDTGEPWDVGHEHHPTHHWESEHRYDGKRPAVKKLYAPGKMHHMEEEGLSLTDKGTYIVEWASLLRDLAALFFEGVGVVILGHFISTVAVVMLAGLLVGGFALHVRTKHVKHKG